MAKAKILVVDDSPRIRQLLESRLAASDYKVSLACDGEEALRKARLERPDVILLDISMPGMDGIEVGRILRNGVETKTIPIIMVTARGERHVMSHAVDTLKPDAYIIKPFTPGALLNSIETVLTGKEEQE